MREQPTVEELYAIVEKIIPEPGIHKLAVMALLNAATAFGEGTIQYFAQMTCETVRDLFSRKQTYHPTINDYDFSKRLHDALQESPPAAQ
jgi:hypothetical protein